MEEISQQIEEMQESIKEAESNRSRLQGHIEASEKSLKDLGVDIDDPNKSITGLKNKLAKIDEKILANWKKIQEKDVWT